MPPKKPKAPPKAQSEVACPVCEDVIQDKSSTSAGQNAIFCDGECQSWLHSKCAGLSKTRLAEVSKDNNTFYCPQCQLARQSVELASLMSYIESLSTDMARMKNQLDSLLAPSDHATQAESAPSGPSRSTYAKIVSRDSNPQPILKVPPQDRKSNLVIYGIAECPQGTSRTSRFTKDLEQVISTLTPLVSSISENAVRDCFRLGKYDPTTTKRRPMLVKLNRVHDVRLALSNRASLSSTPSISIKPHMSPDEARTESILLHKRRDLINLGTPSKEIKIRGNRLFLGKLLLGVVEDSEFVERAPRSVSGTPTTTSTEVAAANNTSASFATPSLSNAGTTSSSAMGSGASNSAPPAYTSDL